MQVEEFVPKFSGSCCCKDKFYVVVYWDCLKKKQKDACLISVNRFLTFKLPKPSIYEMSVFKLPCSNSCSNFLLVKKIRRSWNRDGLCNSCAHWLISVHAALWRNVFAQYSIMCKMPAHLCTSLFLAFSYPALRMLLKTIGLKSNST